MRLAEANIIARANQLLLRCREIAMGEGDTNLLREEKEHLELTYISLRALAHNNSDAARLLWEFPLVLGVWAMPVFGNALICCNRLGERAARSIRDRTEAGEVLISLNCNLAALYAHRGCLTKSADRLRIAIWIAGDLGRTLWQGRLFGELGEILMQTGDLTEAQLWMNDSLTTARTLGDTEGEILAYFRLTQLQRLTGDYAGALPRMETVLGQVRADNSSSLEWKVLVELGILLREQGNLELAERHLKRALDIVGKDLIAQERIYEGLSIIAMRRRDLERAQEYRERAVQINRTLPKGRKLSTIPTCGLEDRLTAASLQMGQGAWNFAQGHTEQACEDFRSALVSFRKASDSAGECEALYNVALAEFRLHQFEEAIAPAQEAFESARVLGHPLLRQAEDLLQQIRSLEGK